MRSSKFGNVEKSEFCEVAASEMADIEGGNAVVGFFLGYAGGKLLDWAIGGDNLLDTVKNYYTK